MVRISLYLIYRVCLGLVEAMSMIGAWLVFVWGMVGK
jgi:hypothetical protein